jgi:hypothetical protein
MRVLVACEFSGVVRDAFNARGHDAWSCDLLPTEVVGPHYQGDVLDLLEGWQPVTFASDLGVCNVCDEPLCLIHDLHFGECPCLGPTQDEVEYKQVGDVLLGRPVASPHWDLMIAHPPCTYLCSSGLHWNKRVEGREAKTQESLEFVRRLLDAPVQRIALENPIGRIGTAIRPADQIIQPWQFGHDASKQTALWLKNLPLLQPTEIVEPRLVNGKKRWANQTDSGQNRLGPSEDRWKLRSETYRGIAEAMADQWGWYCDV